MIRNMKKYGWMAAALLFAVVGCQRREMMYLGDDVAPIHFSVAYQDAEVSAGAGSASLAPQTKALVNLDKGVTVRIFAYKRGANHATGTPDPRKDELVAQCTYVADGAGGLTPCAVKADGTVDATGTVPDAISLNNGTYNFIAYSPALPVLAASDGFFYKVDGVTHGMDVLNTLVADQTVSKAASTVALVFEHKCSKITFNVKQPDGADVTKLKVDSIVLRNMTKVSSVQGWRMFQDFDNTNTSNIGGTKDTVLFKTFGDLNNTDTPAKLIGRTGFGVVLPKAYSPNKIPADIYITLGDSAYLFRTEFPALKYDKGKNYTYNMTLKRTSIEFTLKVLAWGSVGISGDLGEDVMHGVLVGSWYESTSDIGVGDDGDNLTGTDVGIWKPVSPDWELGGVAGSPNPDGNVGGWDDSGVDLEPGGSGGSNNPDGGVGGWGDVNDNQPGLGA